MPLHTWYCVLRTTKDFLVYLRFALRHTHTYKHTPKTIYTHIPPNLKRIAVVLRIVEKTIQKYEIEREKKRHTQNCTPIWHTTWRFKSCGTQLSWHEIRELMSKPQKKRDLKTICLNCMKIQCAFENCWNYF